MRTQFTIRRALLASLALLLSLAATPARAAFHTYQVVEAFSSADGSVQFIRLHEASNADFQNAWAGQTLMCSNGTTTHSLTFPSNLSSGTTRNTSVLIATSNFAALPGGVTPDFILPPSFLIPGAATITFAGFITMNYTSLPTDGQHSVNAQGQQQINTPRNFAGATGSVNVPAGACCNGANCAVSIQSACGGAWTSGATCASNPCAPPSGVCCRGVTCAITTSADCSGANTQFLAASSSCNDAGNRASPCCQADFNHASGISVQDIFDYLNAWFAGSPSADTAGNGASPLVVQNIFDFLSAWFAGC